MYSRACSTGAFSFFVAGALFCALALTHITYASTSSGTIDASFKTAKVCHSVGCVTPTPGEINMKPTGTTPVTIDDILGIDGIAWGNELGWFTFDPTGPEGLVINPTTGAISGKAWSQASGWVNFSPTGQGVSINTAGEFTGWAWTGGPYGGWIRFDCAGAGACVKTDWRPLSARSGGGGGGGGGDTRGNGPLVGSGGGGGSPSDECWNISGIQITVPTGYRKFANNICQATDITPSSGDVCPNIVGVQTSVPREYTLDLGGLCVPPPVTEIRSPAVVTTKPTTIYTQTTLPSSTPPPKQPKTGPVPGVAPSKDVEAQPQTQQADTPPQQATPIEDMPLAPYPLDPLPVTDTAPVEPVVSGPTPVPIAPAPAGPGYVKFSFIPSAFTIPVQLPTFREGFRRVVGGKLTHVLLHDPAPTEPLAVDLVSLVGLIGSGALVAFGGAYGFVRVVVLVLALL